MDERKTNLMHLLYIFIVAVGDALHVSGVFLPSSGALENYISSTGILRGVLWALRWWWWCEACGGIYNRCIKLVFLSSIEKRCTVSLTSMSFIS
jgi:hypothetical protein